MPSDLPGPHLSGLEILIECRMSGPYHLNTYLLTCARTRQTLIIDPGGDARELWDHLDARDMIPKAILMTHGHADQWFDTARFKAIKDIPYCIHGEEEAFFKQEAVRKEVKQRVDLPPPHPGDQLLSHKDELVFGHHCLTVIHTPGHTPGSCCFLCQGHLFTGDTLFAGDIGRTDLPGGDMAQLIASIKTRILPLGPEIQVYPGHHYKGAPHTSSLAQEMRDNPYIVEFILDV